MKKLLLSLVMLSLLPTQLGAMVTTIAKLKNNAGKSITLIGYLGFNSKDLPPKIVAHYEQLSNQHQSELVKYLSLKKNMQLIIDQKEIQPLLHTHTMHALMIEDDIKYKEFLGVNFPMQGLEFFTLEHYQRLLKKCAELEAVIITLDNDALKKAFTDLYNQLKNQESLLRFFQDNRQYNIAISQVAAYEDLIWNLRDVQITLVKYAYIAPLITASAQHDTYAYINFSHIYNPFEGSIINLFRCFGYNLVFYKNVFEEMSNKQDENNENDDLNQFNQLMLDLSTTLAQADKV